MPIKIGNTLDTRTILETSANNAVGNTFTLTSDKQLYHIMVSDTGTVTIEGTTEADGTDWFIVATESTNSAVVSTSPFPYVRASVSNNSNAATVKVNMVQY